MEEGENGETTVLRVEKRRGIAVRVRGYGHVQRRRLLRRRRRDIKDDEFVNERLERDEVELVARPDAGDVEKRSGEDVADG